ncbi:hypothetical protein E2P81_ATG04667 [Venturia nashicola]|nr:hypothetical protein E2P81_ATG04667 [Venturia nashicola]
MITDEQLYSLALFLGASSVLLIVLYHFLEVNATDGEPLSKQRKTDTIPAKVDSGEGTQGKKEYYCIGNCRLKETLPSSVDCIWGILRGMDTNYTGIILRPYRDDNIFDEHKRATP